MSNLNLADAPLAIDATLAEAPPSMAPDAGPATTRWTAGTLTYTSTALVALFFWLLWGDFSLSLKERSVPPTLQLLLNRFSASNALAGFLLGSLPSFITMFLSPIVSYRSDRHCGRFGRRIPYLFLPTPVAVLAMVGLGFSPVLGRWLAAALGVGEPHVNACVLTVIAVFWVMFEVCSIICLSVFSGLCNDVVPRDVLGRFFGMFRVITLAAAMMFNFWLFGKAETHYLPMFLAIAALYAVSFSAMCWKVKEGAYAPAPVAPKSGGLRAAIRTYFRDCFTIPYYLWLILSIALASMSFTCVVLFATFYAKSVGLDMGTYGKYVTLSLMLSLLQAFPLGWLADKIHPLRLTILSLAIYAAATLAAFLLIHDARTFAIWSTVAGTCAGWWVTAYGPLLPALLPKMKYAQFASAIGIGSALGVVIIGPACGWFVDFMGNNYRYIYLWAFVLIMLSLLSSLVVYREFCHHGGPSAYVAPDRDS
jgi:MFS family permease